MNVTSSISLEPDESVELVIRRSPIIRVLIIAGEVLATFVFIAFAIYLSAAPSSSSQSLLPISDASGKNAMLLVIGILYLVLILSGLISLHVNRKNTLYVTNQRLIHQSTTSLFADSLNIIDLASVEDVSFHQSGIFNHLLHLGTIRMSTVGDETTYTFPSVDEPTNEIKVISRLVRQKKEEKKK